MENVSEQRQQTKELALRFMRVFEEAFKRIGLQQKHHPFKELNMNQIRALHLLHHQAGMTQKGLAEDLGITAAAVSTIVRHMQAMNLIDRQTDSADARSVRLFLSEEAQALIAENQQVRCNAMADLLSGLPLDEQRMVVEALERSLKDHHEK